MAIGISKSLPTQNHTRAYLLLTITAWCWGANAVFGRMAVEQLSPMLLVSLRWLGALILLSVVASIQVKRDWPILRQHLLFLGLMGMLGFTAFNGLFYVAAHTTTAVNIGILQGSMPMFVLIGAFLTYRTKVSSLQILGVMITVSGVIIVAFSGQLERIATLTINRGDVLMLIACILYSGYAVGLRKRPAVSSLSLFTVMAAAAFVTSLPLTIAEATIGQLQWPTPKGWLIVTLVTLFPSFIAQIFFIKGVALIGPGRAGVFINLVPVFAAIMAVFLLQESFELYHGIALALVLMGIALCEKNKSD